MLLIYCGKGLPVVRYYTEEDTWTEEPVQTIAADNFSRILPIPHQECYLNTKVQQNQGTRGTRSCDSLKFKVKQI